jgi:hypothetical protein
MAQWWWKRHDNIDMGGYTRSEVEDITGCIPLLLDECLVHKKIDLTVAGLREIYENAAAFAVKVKYATKSNRDKWIWYVRLIRRRLGHY